MFLVLVRIQISFSIQIEINVGVRICSVGTLTICPCTIPKSWSIIWKILISGISLSRQIITNLSLRHFDLNGSILHYLVGERYPVIILSMREPVFGTTATFGGVNCPTSTLALFQLTIKWTHYTSSGSHSIVPCKKNQHQYTFLILHLHFQLE